MKIRITDLLDEYLDDDLPLDAMPDSLPGDRPKQKPNRAAHRPSHRKRAGQIVAAVLIVASVSVAGGLKLWCGGSTGKSLSDTAASAEPSPQAVEQRTAEAAAASTTDEPDTTVEYIGDTPITDGGYMTSSISSDGDGLTVTAGDVSRDGSTYSLKVTIETPMEHVTGFLLDEYDVYLVLADGTVEEVTSSSETSYSENPFVKTEFFNFDDGLSESELAAATLYLQIHSVALSTTDATSLITGQWDMGFSESGYTISTEAAPEESPAPTLAEGQSFTVTDLTVSQSGCTFWLHSDADQFTLVPQGQLSLAAQQGSDETYYGFSILTDGTLDTSSVTIDSSTMSTRGVTDTQNLVYCTVTWKETIEPTSITGLYFTDGTTGQTVEVSSYVY